MGEAPNEFEILEKAFKIFQYVSGLGGGRRTLDCEVSQHLSEESGITQQLYIRGAQKCTFSESSLNFLSENVNFLSVGSVDLILSAAISQSYRDTPVFT